jgi:hypothetical protein
MTGDGDTFPLLLPSIGARGGEGLPWPWAALSQTLISQIDSVEVEILKSNPSSLAISAVGIAPTGGWSGANLVPRRYAMPPVDGIWDIDFLITPPPKGGIVTQALVKHPAGFLWLDSPAGLRGVRVHGTTNFTEALIAGAPPVSAAAAKIAKPSTPADVEFTIEVKRPIYVNQMPGSDSSTLEAKVNLTNPTASPIELVAPTPCDIVNWSISGRGEPVQSEPPQLCARVFVYLILRPGEALVTPLNIVLDKDAYATDDYTLSVSHWGLRGNATVHIEVVH